MMLDTFDSSFWTLVASYAIRSVVVIAILTIAWFAARGLTRALRERLERHDRVDRTLISFATHALRWGLVGLAGLLCLSVFGIEVTSLAALLGAAGVTIGLALQGSLSNLAAGVLLLGVRPFRVGDVVEIADETGRIDHISLMVTRLITLDNKMVTIPNRHVLDDNVCNHTNFRTRRYEVPVGVAYGCDLGQARQALLHAARSVHEDPDHEPQVALTGFGDSSINWVVRAWGPSTDWIRKVDELVVAIDDALARAHIAIPFPQLDLHLQRSEAWQQLTHRLPRSPRRDPGGGTPAAHHADDAPASSGDSEAAGSPPAEPPDRAVH